MTIRRGAVNPLQLAEAVWKSAPSVRFVRQGTGCHFGADSGRSQCARWIAPLARASGVGMTMQEPEIGPDPAPRLVDARGLRCPLPALRLARAVRGQGAGCYLLLADDPAAEVDIPALCTERGWQLQAVQDRSFAVRVPD